MNEPWHFDKRIPIATVATLLLQAAGFAVWIASQTAATNVRLEQMERAQAATMAALATLRVDSRLAVLESQVGDIKEIAKRLEERLAPIGGLGGRP